MESFEWLANVLARIDTFQERTHGLYVQGKPPLNVRTRTIVLERDIYSDELPEFARRHGLSETLSISVAQDIVGNARLQKAEATPAELVEAFNFYWEHDAFIHLE